MWERTRPTPVHWTVHLSRFKQCATRRATNARMSPTVVSICMVSLPLDRGFDCLQSVPRHFLVLYQLCKGVTQGFVKLDQVLLQIVKSRFLLDWHMTVEVMQNPAQTQHYNVRPWEVMSWRKGCSFVFLMNPVSQLVFPLHGQLPFYYIPGAKGFNFVFLLHGYLAMNFLCEVSGNSPDNTLQVLHVSFCVVNTTFKVAVLL